MPNPNRLHWDGLTTMGSPSKHLVGTDGRPVREGDTMLEVSPEGRKALAKQVHGDAKAEPKAKDEPKGFDPAYSNIDEVKAHVEANPDEAPLVAEAERGGKNRSRLLAWLDEFQNDKPAGAGAEDNTSEEN